MSSTVAVPVWLVVLGGLLALWAVLDRLLVPSVRWFLRRRVNRVLEEIDSRLSIRVQSFKLTKRQVLIDRLVWDRQVQEAAEAYAREEGAPRQVAQERVERYAREIVPAFNALIYFRLGYRLARQVARSLYRVRLGFSDDEGLRAVRPDSTVVFVMNHRSNMDYVLVSYLAAERTALSYAVGEWARIWPLESLLRSMGAYFVRRRSRNTLYRCVLQRYVQMATAEGVTQAVYPEGGLTRDGRLQPAKLGLLDYMLRDFDPEEGRDIVFVPVGLNYDRVLEDRTLLLDVDTGGAGPTRRPAFTTTLRFVARNFGLWLRGRWYRFGYACVNFGTPISARDWLLERGIAPRRISREERFAAVAELGAEIMASIGRVVPVLPAALVATVLLENPDRSFDELELKAEVHRRIRRLESAGARVYVPRRDRDYAIDVGLRALTLRHLVEERDGLFRCNPEEVGVLRYYANSIAHLGEGGESASASAS